MPDKFKSRKFLLALFAQIAGILILLFPEHESTISEAVTKGGALLLMALTGAGWIKAEAEVDAARENAKAFTSDVSTPADDDTVDIDAPPSGGGPGRLNGVLILLALLLPLGGCVAVSSPAASPEDAWYEARADLNAANRTFMSWAATVDLNDRDQAMRVVQIGRQLQEARALLNAARLVLDGRPPDDARTVSEYLELIEGILLRVVVPEVTPNGPTIQEPQDGSSPRLVAGSSFRLTCSERDRRGVPPEGRTGRERRHHHRSAA